MVSKQYPELEILERKTLLLIGHSFFKYWQSHLTSSYYSPMYDLPYMPTSSTQFQLWKLAADQSVKNQWHRYPPADAPCTVVLTEHAADLMWYWFLCCVTNHGPTPIRYLYTFRGTGTAFGTRYWESIICTFTEKSLWYITVMVKWANNYVHNMHNFIK